MSQFGEIVAWKCNVCGRVLTTLGGVERHKQHCKEIIPVADGQISMDDLVKHTRRDCDIEPKEQRDGELRR